MSKQIKEDKTLLGPIFDMAVPPKRKETEYLGAYKSWVYSAVSSIAQEVAHIDLKLYKKKLQNGDVVIEEVHDHDALALVNSVNDFYTRDILFETTQTYLELTGEAVWVLLRDNQGNPNQIWALRPDWIEIVPSKTDYISHYIYRPHMAPDGVVIAREDIIFFKETNPTNPMRGMGKVEAGASAIDIDTFADDWNRTFFFNNAVPNLFFTTDQKLKREEIRRFVEHWRASFEGRHNAHKVAFMGGGLKPEVIGSNQKDLDFQATKQSLRDQILAMFNVSKANIGIVDDVNRANQEASDARFSKKVVKPRMTRLVSYLNEFYLRNWPDEDLFFDYTDPIPEDVDMNLRIYENGLQNGWLTINEVRERENLPPATGGDVIRLPVMLQEAGEVTEGKGLFKRGKKAETTLKVRKPAKHKRDIASLNLPIPPTKLKELRKRRMKDDIKQDIVKLLGNMVQVRSKEEKRREFKEAFWKAMIAKTDVAEQSFIEDLQKLFSEQRAEVLNNLEANVETKALKDKIENILFSMDDWEIVFSSAMLPKIKRLVEDKGREMFDFIGMERELDLATPTAEQYLREQGNILTRDINETTRKALNDTLIEGFKAGEGIPELTKRIEAVYDDALGFRAERIARTEVLRATNWATLESYKQSGIVDGKQWLTAIDERVCPICEPMDGVIIPLDDNFKTIEGGFDRPPAHVNCRCTMTPIFDLKSIPNYSQKLRKQKEDVQSEALKKKAEVSLMEEKLENLKAQEKQVIANTKRQTTKILNEAKKEAEDIIKEADKDAVMRKSSILQDIEGMRDKLRKKLFSNDE